MNYVPYFDLFGVDAKQIPCDTGSGAPTSSTEGAVGCLYMDTDTGDIYKCVSATDGVYEWVLDNAELQDRVNKLDTKLDEVAESLVYFKTYTAEGASIDVKNAASIDEAYVMVQEQTVKNYLPNNGKTTTINGVTFTVQNDGRVILSGTATAEAEFYAVEDTIIDYLETPALSLPAGTYYFRGAPAGASYTTYYMRLTYRDNGSWKDLYNYSSSPIVLDNDTVFSNHILRIVVNAGVNVDGLVFEPMLVTDPNAEYVPYSQTGYDGAVVTVKDNGTSNTETVAVNTDGTVTGIPIYDDMTLSVPSGYSLHLKYTTASKTMSDVVNEVKVENDQQSELITELTDRVTRLEETSEEPENKPALGVSDYFADEVSITINTITEKCGGTALVLNIVTDTHEEFSDSESVRICNEMYANMKAVNAGVHCDALIHLGDSCGSPQSLYPDWLTVNKHLQSTRKRLSDCNDHSVMLVGNHDGINSMTPNEKITYNAMYAYTRDYVERPGAVPYGYMDFEDRKIRCVFLSTTTYNTSTGAASLGFGWDQFKWFADVACATDDGWQLLVFSHYSPYDLDLEKFYYANLIAKEIVKILNAYTNHTAYSFNDSNVSVTIDFTTKTTTKAVAWVCGHGHYDRITTDNTYITDFSLCCPVIQTACARLEQENEIPDDNADGVNDPDVVSPARTTKTVTQDLWDTLVYRQDENKIYMVRFGAGEDREINLNT